LYQYVQILAFVRMFICLFKYVEIPIVYIF